MRSSNLSPVLEAERRSWSYWFIDGLFDILGGVGWLLLAGYSEMFRKPTPLEFFIALCCYLLFLALIFRSQQILAWVKERVTYPRTGYVQPPYYKAPEITELRIDNPDPEPGSEVQRARRNRALGSLPGAILFGAALVLLMMIKTPWICLVAAVLWGFAIRPMSGRGIKPSLTIMLGLILVGFGVSLLGLDGLRRVDVLAAGAGIVLVIDGGIRLARYLRRNPVAGT